MDLVVANLLQTRRKQVIIYASGKEAKTIDITEDEELESLLTKEIKVRFEEFNA